MCKENMSSLIGLFLLMSCMTITSIYAAVTTTTVATKITASTLATTKSLAKPNDQQIIRKCGTFKAGGLLEKQPSLQVQPAQNPFINDTSNTNANLNLNISGNVINDDNKKEQLAEFGEFPWTIAIYLKNNENQKTYLTCVGSLILPNVVMTGALCVEDHKKEDLTVKAGLWDSNAKSNEKYPVQERIVSQIIYHPEFLKENATKKIKSHDIALLVLEKPIELSDHINLICLPNKDHKEKSTKCYVSGWGKKIENKSLETGPRVLKKLHLPVVNNDDCEKKLKEKKPTLVLTDETICAGGDDKINPIPGDGGAPLVCQVELRQHPAASTSDKEENRYIQSGIVSWGFQPASHLPDVFTNVAKYRDWIDEQIKKLGGDTKLYTITSSLPPN